MAIERVHAQTVHSAMLDKVDVQGSNSHSTIVKVIWIWMRRSSKKAVMSDLASLWKSLDSSSSLTNSEKRGEAVSEAGL